MARLLLKVLPGVHISLNADGVAGVAGRQFFFFFFVARAIVCGVFTFAWQCVVVGGGRSVKAVYGRGGGDVKKRTNEYRQWLSLLALC